MSLKQQITLLIWSGRRRQRWQIVASGTPEQVVKEERSYTGKYLKEILERDTARMKREDEWG